MSGSYCDGPYIPSAHERYDLLPRCRKTVVKYSAILPGCWISKMSFEALDYLTVTTAVMGIAFISFLTDLQVTPTISANCKTMPISVV